MVSVDFDHDAFVRNAVLPRHRDRVGSASVYVMHSGRYVKVGLAENPKDRRATLQRSNPAKVILDRSFGFDDRRYAILAERTALDLLAPWRVRGEWFSAKPVEVTAVVLGVVRATNELYARHTLSAYR